MSIEHTLFMAGLALVFSAVIAPVFGRNKSAAGWVNLVFMAVSAVFFCIAGVTAVLGGGAHGHVTIGGFTVPWLIDGFSGFFLIVISFMSFMASIYSVRYMEHYGDRSTGGYYFAYPLFILGMAGIVTVDDLTLGFTAAWQCMTIASYSLIRFEKTDEVKRKSLRYLLFMETAWVFVMAAAFFSGEFRTGATVHDIARSLGSREPVYVFAFYGLMILGFGFKAGVFPLGQLWLPDAHSMAPSPVSALLSGVMIKTGIYGIIRTFFWMLPSSEGLHFSGFFWGIIISSIGAATLFIGTVQCVKQDDTKRLLAYSSIGQVGYIILGAGAALMMLNSNSEAMKVLACIALIGTVYHVLNHAVFKGLLFLSAGTVLYVTGERDLNRLGGLMKVMPLCAVAAAIASLSISGMPPFSGFASKWTIITSALLSGKALPALMVFGIIALFTSAITLSAYVKFFGMTYAARPASIPGGRPFINAPGLMAGPKAVLAIICVVLGLVPWYVIRFITTMFMHSGGSSIEGPLRGLYPDIVSAGHFAGITFTVPSPGGGLSSVVMPAFLILVLVIAFILARSIARSGGSETVVAETWLCGYQSAGENNRYRAGGIYDSFKRFFRWTGGNIKKVKQ